MSLDRRTMLPCVLLQGQLTPKKLDQALAEISSFTDAERITLIVASNDGGDMDAALDFVEAIKLFELNHRLALKIYAAYSSAAYISISVGKYRELHADASIILHAGTLRFEAMLLDINYGLPPSMIATCKRSYEALRKAMNECGIDDPKLMGGFQGGGKMQLTAEYCLRLGIVQELF